MIVITISLIGYKNIQRGPN